MLDEQTLFELLKQRIGNFTIRFVASSCSALFKSDIIDVLDSSIALNVDLCLSLHCVLHDGF